MVKRMTSKEILADSLSELLAAKPFEKITVTEITANCGIAKRTFYYYFRDKYELALWMYIHQLDAYYEENPQEISFRSLVTHCANVLWKDRFLIQNVLQYSGQNNLVHSVYEPLIKRYLYLIKEYYGDEITDTIRDAVTFYVGGMISYAEHGLAEREPPTPEKGVAIFEVCIPRVLEKYLYNDPPVK